MYPNTLRLLDEPKSRRETLVQSMVPMYGAANWWSATIANTVSDLEGELRYPDGRWPELVDLVLFLTEQALGSGAKETIDVLLVRIHLVALIYRYRGGLDGTQFQSGDADRLTRQVLDEIDITRESAEQRARFLWLLGREYGASAWEPHLDELRALRRLKNRLMWLNDIWPHLSAIDLRTDVEEWIKIRALIP